MTPGQLGTELVSNIRAALGLVASLAIDVSLWNWYGFPTAYSAASLADEVIGFTAAGLGMAWIIKPGA